MTLNNTDWTSFHIFLSGPEELESFIQTWLAPKAKTIIDNDMAQQWFFMRYWHGGPHVRVRFLGLTDVSSILKEMTLAAQNFKTINPLNAKDYYESHGFDGEPIDLNLLPWYEDGSVLLMDYEPEYQRYGGKEALVANEDLFHASSQLALVIMKSTVGNIDKRLQLSLLLIMSSVFAFKPSVSALKQFCSYYALFWQSHADTNSNKTNSATVNTDVYNSISRLVEQVKSETCQGIQGLWVHKLHQAIEKFSDLKQKKSLISPISNKLVTSDEEYDGAVLSIIGSQIHMLNNRLGVTPPYEYHLSNMILDAIQSKE